MTAPDLRPRHFATGRRLGRAPERPPAPVIRDQTELELNPPPPAKPGPLEAAFVDFHSQHPEVFGQLKSLALAAVRAGRKRLSIAQLFEVVRWELETMGRGPDGFKLNNNHKPFYARELMATVPELAGVFETRERWAR